MEYFVENYTYIAVVVLLLLGGFGVPIPEDIPLILSGYISYKFPEHVNIWVMVPVAFGAVMLGDLTMYILGRKFGHRITQYPLFRRYLTPDRLEKAQLKFHEHGGKALFIARFLPGLRTATFFSAGLFKIPAWKMIAFDGLAALLSVPALVLLPWYFGDQIKFVEQFFREAHMVFFACLGLTLVLYYAYRRMRSHNAKPPASVTTPPGQA